MNPWVRLFLPVALLFSAGGISAFAQEEAPRDSLEVHFRVGQDRLDLNYLDNRQQVDDFVARVKGHYKELPEHSLELVVYGGASPEGPAELNRRLGEQRGLALREVLVEQLGDMLSDITVVNQGARWGALYNMVNAGDEPWKEDVLAVLRKAPEPGDWKVDPRETKLRKMKGGAVWNELSAKYLTKLRSSGSAAVFPIADPIPYDCNCCDTLVIRDTLIYLPEPYPIKEEPIDLSPVWALKTNFLLWAAAAPNVEAEFPLGTKNRWSIEGEIFWPWWIWNHNANAHEFGNVGVEVRYWLGDRTKHHLLDGLHVGLGAALGYYDTELEAHHGYQGEYLNLYGNVGYQMRFGPRKQWAVSAGLGLGWIPTNYREYLGSSVFPENHTEEYDYHLMWQKTSSRHIFGLTHANVTLSYMFHWGDKPKSNR